MLHSYSYDLAGNRVRADYGTGRSVQTGYDALNHPELISEGGRVTRYGYDVAGRAVMLVAGNGQTAQNSYDALGRLVARTLFKTPAMGESEVLAEFNWTHDLLGNVRQQLETWPGDVHRSAGVRSTTMTYDADNRLSAETVVDPTSGTTTTAYAYDAANNRSSKTVTGGSDPGVWHYLYNAVNQLMSWEQRDVQDSVLIKSATLAYDEAGNRVSQTVSSTSGSGINPSPAAGGTTSYQWDAQDRLSAVTLPNGETHAYAYDYRTRRIGTQKFAGAVRQSLTAIVFAGGLSVAEFDTATDTLPDNPTVEYTRGPDMGGGVGGMLYSLRGGSARYSLSNGRGDIVGQADQGAALTWTASYEAYGRRTVETGENQDKQRANTKDEDPTGLLNEGFRYRDLETGVWLSRDPAGFVDGPNVYAYVQQNPWSKWDPHGLSWQDWASTAADFIPGVSTVKSAVELVTGKDVFTGEAVSRAEAAAGLGASFIPGGKGALKVAKTACKIADKAFEVKGKAEAAMSVASDIKEGNVGLSTLMDAASLRGGGKNKGDGGGPTPHKDAGGGPPSVPTIACFTAGTPVACADGSVPIETLQVGDRVLTTDDEHQHHDTEVDPQTWKKVTLAMVNEECRWDVLDLVVIRSPEWLRETNCQTGEQIWFVLDEIGLEGWAKVQRIEPCPTIKPGHGRVVLSTLTHYNGDVYQMRLDGFDEAIEPTGRHRLFSATRNDWVRTETFTEGEQLKTRDGIQTIASIGHRIGIHRVYNIEVETEHCYYVGSQQVLSHNQNPCAARPKDGSSMNTDQALGHAESYLGEGYRQLDSGVFVSKDGTRLVRMTDSDLAKTGNHAGAPHMNFEEGKTITTPNLSKPGGVKETFKTKRGGNSHVYLPQER